MNLKDEAYLVEIIKDQLAYVALDARAEMARAMPKKHSQVAREVVLPDGIDNARGIVRDPRDPRCALPPDSHRILFEVPHNSNQAGGKSHVAGQGRTAQRGRAWRCAG